MSEGIFLLDPITKDVVQLAGYPSPFETTGLIKYSFLANGDGSFDFVFVPDSDGTLYHFTVEFDGDAISASDVEMKLEPTDELKVNGPAYCGDRREIGFGVINSTSVHLKLIEAEDVAEMASSTVAEAEDWGMLTSIQTDEFQISADLTCGNISDGLVYVGKDCSDSASVGDCLESGQHVSSIHFKESEGTDQVQLSFPEQLSAPPGIPVGDTDPDVFVSNDGKWHLMFDRIYTTSRDPSSTDFGQLVYIQSDPFGVWSPEYVVDLSGWHGQPAEQVVVLQPYMKPTTETDETLRIAAFGMISTPEPVAQGDKEPFGGLFTADLDISGLAQNTNGVIAVDPNTVDEALSFAEFVCRVWDSCGMAPDGNVYLYGLHAPRFLVSPSGREYIVFSASKDKYGPVTDGHVTHPGGSPEPLEGFYTTVCGSR